MAEAAEKSVVYSLKFPTEHGVDILSPEQLHLLAAAGDEADRLAVVTTAVGTPLDRLDAEPEVPNYLYGFYELMLRRWPTQTTLTVINNALGNPPVEQDEYNTSLAEAQADLEEAHGLPDQTQQKILASFAVRTIAQIRGNRAVALGRHQGAVHLHIDRMQSVGPWVVGTEASPQGSARLLGAPLVDAVIDRSQAKVIIRPVVRGKDDAIGVFPGKVRLIQPSIYIPRKD